MAKDNAELQAMPQPQSRNEKYLNYLAGRAVDLNLLPDPQSRIEEYLEYLCYNRGAGGGGGQPFNGVTNVTYNAQTKELVVTHSNGLIDNLNLSNLSDVTDVQYDNNTHIMTVTRNGVPSEIDLSKLNTKINNVAPVDGNIQLALNQAGDDISLTVGGQDAGTIDLAGFVKSVNNISPLPGSNGNITLNAEHMNYDDVSNIGADTVQKAIEKLKEDMDLIDGAEIHIVADKNELDGLVAASTLNKGDIVYVINSNGVIDYNNVNVDNGNNPASMIYDDAVGGNHLRLFSKVVPTINLNASNVAFNSNNVDGVTANNVQTAIEEVNATTRNSYATSTYDAQTGKLTLTKHNGTSNEYDLATGTVKTVNQQPSDGQGNVKVDAEHIEYNNQTSQLTSQNVQEVLDYLEEDKASLNKNNVFIGHNTFNEVNLLGKNVFVSTVGGKQNSAHKTGIYCGDRRVSTHHNSSPNPKYISAIKIEVLPSVNVGDMVSGVYVTEIEKKADRLTDIVGKTIINDGSFIVEEDKTGVKVIYVPIQKEYTVDTYFLVGKTGDRNLREAWEGYPPQEEYINNLPINNLPQIGNQLNWTTGNGWIIIYSLTDDEMNVREELKLLNDKVSNAVTSVNKETPIDGDVTINAGHIGYDGNTSNIIATNVQDAIDELKRDVNLVNGATIYIVQDNTELSNLLNRNVVNHGDLIYIINSAGVVDFNNQPADGGNPVAMIYDNTLTGNKLRVFSKFSSNVNVSADNVSYDDTQTNLQANNVQDAIGKLNEKIVNAGGGTVTSVNGINPQGGEVTLTATVTQNVGQDIVFQVGNQANFATLQCMTNQDVTTIIDGFIL